MGFTSIWNMFGYPAGDLPITTVKWNEEFYTDTHNDRVTIDLKAVMPGTQGLPIGVQIVGLPNS
jgi:Asp-tRNA(Asn)/Glu-tRNA(Gln) amidotransferase A subunit family amidase